MTFQEIPQLQQPGSYEVNIPLQFLAERVKQFQKEYNLQINPDFQRGHIWTEAQQIAYVEYYLAGGRSGMTFYFNQPSWQMRRNKNRDYDDFVLVDGLQRLTALLRFLNNEIMAYGQYVDDFDQPLRFADNMHFKWNINNIQTRAGVLNWYLEMNSGGTPHTKDELDRVRTLLKSEEI